jgi:hypothetical protein
MRSTVYIFVGVTQSDPSVRVSRLLIYSVHILKRVGRACEPIVQLVAGNFRQNLPLSSSRPVLKLNVMAEQVCTTATPNLCPFTKARLPNRSRRLSRSSTSFKIPKPGVSLLVNIIKDNVAKFAVIRCSWQESCDQGETMVQRCWSWI